MDENQKKIYDVFEKLGITYKEYTHPPVHTMEDIRVLNLGYEGEVYKSLFLRNAAGDKHYLVLMPEQKRGDLKKLEAKLGSTRLSFASDERLKKYLDLYQGCVGPYGLINDVNNEVIVLIDKDINKLEKITLHPNTNEALVTVTVADFFKFMDSVGNTYKTALLIM